jgi:hypothetical protein
VIPRRRSDLPADLVQKLDELDALTRDATRWNHVVRSQELSHRVWSMTKPLRAAGLSWREPLVGAIERWFADLERLYADEPGFWLARGVWLRRMLRTGDARVAFLRGLECLRHTAAYGVGRTPERSFTPLLHVGLELHDEVAGSTPLEIVVASDVRGIAQMLGPGIGMDTRPPVKGEKTVRESVLWLQQVSVARNMARLARPAFEASPGGEHHACLYLTSALVHEAVLLARTGLDESARLACDAASKMVEAQRDCIGKKRYDAHLTELREARRFVVPGPGASVNR